MAMTEEEKKATAVHEAGHALLNVLLPNTDALHKVSIIPRGPALGVTMYLPEKDRVTNWKKEVLDYLVVVMGGRVAEEIFLGDVSSGASGDIQQATRVARAMVCDWGMSELAHVRDVEQTRGGADGDMLVDDACVLNRQFPSRERDHASAEPNMAVEHRRASNGFTHRFRAGP